MRLISHSKKSHPRSYHREARIPFTRHFALPRPRALANPHKTKTVCHSDSQPSLGECNLAQPSLLRFRPGRGYLPEQRPGLPRISDLLGGNPGGYPHRILIERLATRHEVT